MHAQKKMQADPWYIEIKKTKQNRKTLEVVEKEILIFRPNIHMSNFQQ